MQNSPVKPNGIVFMNLPGKEKLKQYLLKSHPDWLAAYDYYFNPVLRRSWGGPFNGQAGRQQIFREIISSIKFQTIIETGAFRATTTEFLSTESALPVYTVESEPRFFHYARLRLRRRRSVHVELGDSRAFLERLARDPSLSKQNAFFYLDSHWGDDLPLKREVELIANTWKGVVIMIDDFEVPGDGGYSFDDYGAGQRLCLDFLQPLPALGLRAFFPVMPSAHETGSKRGCVVLTDGTFADCLEKLRSLRPG
jgi:hypothetical protein